MVLGKPSEDYVIYIVNPWSEEAIDFMEDDPAEFSCDYTIDYDYQTDIALSTLRIYEKEEWEG